MHKSWRLKRALIYPFTLSRFGEDVYEWLTAVGLGTQHGLSRKWCYWFREHVVLCRRYARMSIPGKRVWLFEPGWSLAPVLLARLASGRGPLITEPRPRLARRYLPVAVGAVAEVAEHLCRSSRQQEFDLPLLEDLRAVRSPRAVLTRCGADYRAWDLDALGALATGSVDWCLSMGRLEHYQESNLVVLLAHMRQAMSPGSVGSHIVDHRDHFWHFDKSNHCFHHLTFSDEQWQRIAKGRRLYRNRLIESDYVRLFQEAGFDILACVNELHRDDARGVDPASLWGRYRELATADLAAAVSHFIVRRP